jgi:S1-C subfamily serine protease
MSSGETGGIARLSEGLADAVAAVAASVARVDDGSMLTASGVIWEADGVVVAASHAVESDEGISVILGDGSRHDATLVGRDRDSDLAVLKVAATGLPAIPRETDESAARVGSLALAVARPGDAGLVATLGVISRKQETQTDGNPEYVLNTDAVLYPGFSGGPLVSANGRMLGLIDRLFGRGMGVALGVPLVARVVDALRAEGTAKRGYLGVRTQLVNLPEGLRAGLALTQERGLLVANVETGSAADAAGLLLGDTLLKLDDAPLEDVFDLRRHLKAGRAVTLTLLRGGQLQQVAATIGEAGE